MVFKMKIAMHIRMHIARVVRILGFIFAFNDSMQ